MKKYFTVAACTGLISFLSAAHATPSMTGKWATIEGGYSFSLNPNNVSIEPMPNVNLPDNYLSTGLGNRGLVGVGAGLTFDLSYKALHSDRLGLMYNYYDNAPITGQIVKYQLIPTYSDSYNVNSNVLWVDNQLDLISLGQFLPFFDVAIGAVWHQTSGYQETPLPNVSSQRVRLDSAALASNTSTDFAWRVGLGGNFAVTDKISLGLIYRYVNLGNAVTGASTYYPTVGGIHSNVAGNEAVLSLRYNFDTNGGTK